MASPSPMALLLLLALSCPVGSLAQPTQAWMGAVYSAFTDNGVSSIPLSDSAASLLVLREAFAPVALDLNQQPLVAAGTFGLGAVVVAGHETLLNFAGSAFPLNAALWLANSAQAPAAAPSVIFGRITSGSNPFNANSLPSQSSRFVLKSSSRIAPMDLANGPAAANLSLALLDTYTTINASEVAALVSFVSKGGALLVGGHTWWWAYSNPDKVPERDHPTNVLLNKFGLTVTPNIGYTSSTVNLPASLPSASYYLNAYAAATALLSASSLSASDRAAAIASVKAALLGVPTDSLGPATLSAVKNLSATYPANPTPSNPFNAGASPVPLETLSVTFEVAKDLWLSAADIKPAPGSDAFPGLGVPLIPQLQAAAFPANGTYTAQNGRYTFGAKWFSTGVYAVPGKPITVSIPARLIGSKLAVRIGCHTDGLWGKSSWVRTPQITKVVGLTQTDTVVASAFGGLVYILVPPNVVLGMFDVQIAGYFVRAPLFISGVTTAVAWAVIRAFATAPWAELASSKLVLTVPTSVIANLADPQALMDWWDSILDAHARLSQISPDRPRAERLVVDADISAGWMHSGYPIMGYLSVAPDETTLSSLKVDGEWGMFHELGHNHQLGDMEIAGHTGECTVNIWSVHAMTTVVGKTQAQGYGHSALTPASRQSRIAQFISSGRPWSTWSVWLCLETYLQLYEGFGWDFFYRLFNEYQTIPDAQRPQTTDDNIQQFVVRASRQAGVNLAPFFLSWSWPVSAATASNTSSLPAWTANPMPQLSSA